MRYHVLIAAAFALAGVAGCTQQQKVEADNAGRQAGTQIERAADQAKHSLADGSITLKVKGAMHASDKLNTSAINVDTKDRVVYLRGAVPDADQKARAERIANDTVDKDVKVVNELAISPDLGQPNRR